MGQYYMSMKSQHTQNEWLFCNRGRNTIVNIVASVGKKKKTFTICCNVLAFEARSTSHYFWSNETIVLVLEGEEHPKKTLEQ
jgi:hypothetical protein